VTLKQKVTEILNEADSDIINEFFHSEITDNTAWDSDEVIEFRKKLSDSRIGVEICYNLISVDSYRSKSSL